jgi:hypothetical protein
MPALRGRDVCFIHAEDPETVAKRRQAWAKGGRLGGGSRKRRAKVAGRWEPPPPPISLEDLTVADFWRLVALVRQELRRRIEAGEIAVDAEAAAE